MVKLFNVELGEDESTKNMLLYVLDSLFGDGFYGEPGLNCQLGSQPSILESIMRPICDGACADGKTTGVGPVTMSHRLDIFTPELRSCLAGLYKEWLCRAEEAGLFCSHRYEDYTTIRTIDSLQHGALVSASLFHDYLEGSVLRHHFSAVFSYVNDSLISFSNMSLHHGTTILGSHPRSEDHLELDNGTYRITGSISDICRCLPGLVLNAVSSEIGKIMSASSTSSRVLFDNADDKRLTTYGDQRSYSSSFNGTISDNTTLDERILSSHKTPHYAIWGPVLGACLLLYFACLLIGACTNPLKRRISRRRAYISVSDLYEHTHNLETVDSHLYESIVEMSPSRRNSTSSTRVSGHLEYAALSSQHVSDDTAWCAIQLAMVMLSRLSR